MVEPWVFHLGKNVPFDQYEATTYEGDVFYSAIRFIVIRLDNGHSLVKLPGLVGSISLMPQVWQGYHISIMLKRNMDVRGLEADVRVDKKEVCKAFHRFLEGFIAPLVVYPVVPVGMDVRALARAILIPNAGPQERTESGLYGIKLGVERNNDAEDRILHVLQTGSGVTLSSECANSSILVLSICSLIQFKILQILAKW